MAAVTPKKIALTIIVLVTIINSSTGEVFKCEQPIKSCGENITTCNLLVNSGNLNITTDSDKCCIAEGSQHLCYRNATDCMDCYPTMDCQWQNETCASQAIANNTNFTTTETNCTDRCPTTTSTSTTTLPTTTEDSTTMTTPRCSKDTLYWDSQHRHCVAVCVWEALHSVNIREVPAEGGEVYKECKWAETVAVIVVIVVVTAVIIIVAIVLIVRHVKRKGETHPKFEGIQMNEMNPEGPKSQPTIKRKLFGHLASLKNRQRSKKNDYKQGPGDQEGRIEASEDEYASCDSPDHPSTMPRVMPQVSEEEYLDPTTAEASQEDYENELIINKIAENRALSSQTDHTIHPASSQTAQSMSSLQIGQQYNDSPQTSQQYNDDETYENMETIRRVTGQADEEEDGEKEYVDMTANQNTIPKPTTSGHNQYVTNVAPSSLVDHLKEVISTKPTKSSESDEEYSDVDMPDNFQHRQYAPKRNMHPEPRYADQQPRPESKDEEIYQNY